MEWLVLNSNVCHHFTVYKQMINIKESYYQYVEPFNCAQKNG